MYKNLHTLINTKRETLVRNSRNIPILFFQFCHLGGWRYSVNFPKVEFCYNFCILQQTPLQRQPHKRRQTLCIMRQTQQATNPIRRQTLLLKPHATCRKRECELFNIPELSQSLINKRGCDDTAVKRFVIFIV